jgi:hypothetical protein
MRRKMGGGRLEGVFVIASLCGDWYERIGGNADLRRISVKTKFVCLLKEK